MSSTSTVNNVLLKHPFSLLLLCQAHKDKGIGLMMIVVVLTKIILVFQDFYSYSLTIVNDVVL